MSLLVVDRAEQLERISQLSEAVKKVSASEADKKRNYEKQVNRFLDFILTEKEWFRTRAEDLRKLLPTIEEFSWFSDLDEDGVSSMQEVIRLMKQLHEVMRGRFISANVFFTRKNIGTQELKEYKAVADDMKELAGDLHARFFVFSFDNEFQSITDELNGL